MEPKWNITIYTLELLTLMKIQGFGKDIELQKLLYIAAAVLHGIFTLGKKFIISNKIKPVSEHYDRNSPRYLPRRNGCLHSSQDLYKNMHGSIFHNSPNRKQPKCPSVIFMHLYPTQQ